MSFIICNDSCPLVFADKVTLDASGPFETITWRKLPHATGWSATCPRCGGTIYTGITHVRPFATDCVRCHHFVQVP